MSEEEAAVENGVEDVPEEVPAPVVDEGPKKVLMTDSYDDMVKLADPAWKCEGAPNFRRLAGFPIFGTGQPAQADLEKCLEQVTKKYDEQKKVLWVNLRQEPVVYVNGKSYSVRMSDDLNEHLISNEAFEINNIENNVVGELKKAGEFKFFKDKMGEHFREMETDHKEEAGKVESISTLSEIYSGMAKKCDKLESLRIPINLESAPNEDTFDMIIRLLKGHSAAVPVVFSCQAGLTRTTVGIVIAGLIKEAQLEQEFRRLTGTIPECVINELREKKLGLKEPEENGTKANDLMSGNFDVVKELIAAYPDAKMCKLQLDKLIDTAGKGCENLRELIAFDKGAFDVAADTFTAFLKKKIVDQIERYSMLIVFAMYCKEIGVLGFTKTFKKWMEENNSIRDMIQDGKSKVQWDRRIPENIIDTLKSLLDMDDFDKNLPQVINMINQSSYKMFSDLPRGDQKSKSMRKLAGKTLLLILPQRLLGYLEKKLGGLGNVPDFYDMVGQLSYYAKEECKSALA